MTTAIAYRTINTSIRINRKLFCVGRISYDKKECFVSFSDVNFNVY